LLNLRGWCGEGGGRPAGKGKKGGPGGAGKGGHKVKMYLPRVSFNGVQQKRNGRFNPKTLFWVPEKREGSKKKKQRGIRCVGWGPQGRKKGVNLNLRGGLGVTKKNKGEGRSRGGGGER